MLKYKQQCFDFSFTLCLLFLLLWLCFSGFTSLLLADIKDSSYFLSAQGKHHVHRVLLRTVDIQVPRPFVSVTRLLNNSSSEILTAIIAVQHWRRLVPRHDRKVLACERPDAVNHNCSHAFVLSLLKACF